MDQRAAERLVAAMAKHRSAKFPADLKVMITADAGHYPAIDQPGEGLEGRWGGVKRWVGLCNWGATEKAAARVCAA